jgi:hypothetical protein
MDERLIKLEELRKIKEETDALLIEKAQIVKDINVPIYKAKTEAEQITKNAREVSDATTSAANKIFDEAKIKHSEAIDLLHAAKGDIEQFKKEKAKLDQDRIDLDGLRFQHENVIKQQRNANSQIEAQNRADTDRIQAQFIEVKQREDSVSRRELGVKKTENDLKEYNSTLEARKLNLDEQELKLEALKKALASEREELLEKEDVLIAIKRETESITKKNHALLEEAKMRKDDLTRQQNDLARQIEIFDNSKVENEEAMKSLKEQQRLVEMKMRQNDEKVAKLNELRKANG